MLIIFSFSILREKSTWGPQQIWSKLHGNMYMTNLRRTHHVTLPCKSSHVSYKPPKIQPREFYVGSFTWGKIHDIKIRRHNRALRHLGRRRPSWNHVLHLPPSTWKVCVSKCVWVWMSVCLGLCVDYSTHGLISPSRQKISYNLRMLWWRLKIHSLTPSILLKSP